MYGEFYPCKCPCSELEELRQYKREAEKLIREMEQDLVNISRRCAALSETLRVAVRERK